MIATHTNVVSIVIPEEDQAHTYHAIWAGIVLIKERSEKFVELQTRDGRELSECEKLMVSDDQRNIKILELMLSAIPEPDGFGL